jgi:hypothetical protein
VLWPRAAGWKKRVGTGVSKKIKTRSNTKTFNLFFIVIYCFKYNIIFILC